jgi:predicted nucleic acid-binding protein
VIVADANLIASFAVVGPDTVLAREIFAKDRIWIAPQLWESEILNMLVGKVRRKECVLSDAERMFQYAHLLMKDYTYPVDFRLTLAVADRTKCSGYDSQYVALAEAKNVQLVTWDGGILVNAPHVAVSPEQFLAA